MAHCTVWFNKSLSSIFSILKLIREADAARHFRLCCSHPQPGYIGFLSADCSFTEPKRVTDEEYLDFALEACREQKVEVLLPTHRALYLEEHRAQFEALGVNLFSPAPLGILRFVNDKVQLYEHLAATPDVVPLPAHAVATSLEEFDAAYEQLAATHEHLCMKPVSSMYGLGFRRLVNGGTALKRLLSGDTFTIDREHLRGMMQEAESFPPVMVMPYLEGPERSVDCLADQGELVTAVIRLKLTDGSGAQIIEDNPEVLSVARNLTRQLQLNGLYNIQLRESGGIPFLLEINVRMSGGLPFTAVSGVNLPYWALRIAEGTVEHGDVPQPRTGARFLQFTDCVVAPA